MRIPPFNLERYFALYEFNAPYLLSSSDCDSFSVRELLDMAHQDRTACGGVDLKVIFCS